MFGINGGEFLVLAVVAIVVVGPERLPRYAEQLGRWVRQLRVILADARDKVAEELGPEVGDVDWESLDPRRYDPRRIVRDALSEEIDQIRDSVVGGPPGRGVPSGATAASAANGVTGAAGGPGRRPGPRIRAGGTVAGPGVGHASVPPGPTPFDDEAT